MLKEMLIKNRSYRRYDAGFTVPEETLCELIGLARYINSSANKQALRFRPVCEAALREKLFAVTRWAKLLENYSGPQEHERPGGYIVICRDAAVWPNAATLEKDVGVAAAAITLGAVEKGLGCCMINNFSAQGCREALELPETLEPALVVAIGKPAEEIILEDAKTGGDTKYYRDENGVHHVPKLSLDKLII